MPQRLVDIVVCLPIERYTVTRRINKLSGNDPALDDGAIAGIVIGGFSSSYYAVRLCTTSCSCRMD